MDMPSPAYRRFFKLLEAKLFKTDFINDRLSGKSKRNTWHHKIKDKKGNDTGESFIINRFGVSPMYFPQKVTESRDKPDVPLVPIAFVKAIEYIDDIPEELSYEKIGGTEWEAHAESLKQEFIKKHGLGELLATQVKIKEPLVSSVKNDSDKVVTHPSEIIEFKLCCDVLKKFYEKICNNEYRDAWNLLTADAQERVVKIMSYREFFRRYFFNIKSVEIIKPYAENYSHRKVYFKIETQETNKVYDLNELIEKAEAGNSLLKETLEKINDHFTHLEYYSDTKKNLKYLSKKVLTDYKLQKYIWILAPTILTTLAVQTYLSKPKLITRHQYKDCSFRFESGQWLIDGLSDFGSIEITRDFFLGDYNHS